MKREKKPGAEGGSLAKRRSAKPVLRASTISGVPVVTIPADHYAELLDCRRRVLASAAREAKQRASRLH